MTATVRGTKAGNRRGRFGRVVLRGVIPGRFFSDRFHCASRDSRRSLMPFLASSAVPPPSRHDGYFFRR